MHQRLNRRPANNSDITAHLLLGAAFALVLAGCPGEGPADAGNEPEPEGAFDAGPDDRGCVALSADDDADGDGLKDECDVCVGDDLTGDTDGDGVCDDRDPCPTDSPDDTDGDGVCDSVDICPDADDTFDNDEDGYPCALDCDDADPSLRPDALWWPDTDGDGFGDQTALAIASCTQPDGHLANDLDCNDERDWVYPGAPEVCDGFDSDCDASTDEPAGAFARRDGVFVDVGGAWAGSSAASPTDYVSTQDEQLFFCGLDVYASFDILHNVEVRFATDAQLFPTAGRPAFEVNPGGPTNEDPDDNSPRLRLAQLNLTGLDAPLVQAQSAHVVLEDIRLVNNTGAGGSLLHAEATVASLRAVEVYDSQGPAIHVIGPPPPIPARLDRLDFSLTDAHFQNLTESPTRGGAIRLEDVDATLTNVSTFVTSTATEGGAIYALAGSLDLQSVHVQNATASTGGGIHLANIQATGEDILIEDTATVSGSYGGMVIFDSVFDLSFLTVLRAYSATEVGGLAVFDSAGRFNVLRLEDNESTDGTAGLATSYSQIHAEGVLISGGYSGIEYVFENPLPFFEVAGNRAGGLEVGATSAVYLRDAQFFGNSAPTAGAVRVSRLDAADGEAAGSGFTVAGDCSFQLNDARHPGNLGPGALAREAGPITLQQCEMGDPNAQPYTDNQPDDLDISRNCDGEGGTTGPECFANYAAMEIEGNTNGYLQCAVCEALGGGCLSPSWHPNNPPCSVPAGYADGDGDGVSNAFDRCTGLNDFADHDEDGLPCRFDPDDLTMDCPAGTVLAPNGQACSDASCLFADGDCPLANSCKTLLTLRPEAPSGLYDIDPDGDGPLPTMQAHCDMVTDGGGWTLVANYARPIKQFLLPEPLSERFPLPSRWMNGRLALTNAWGHVTPALIGALTPTEVRFRGAHGVQPPNDVMAAFNAYANPRMNYAGPLMHVKTNDAACVSYLSTGTGSCSGAIDALTPLDDNAAVLPTAAEPSGSDAGDLALTDSPIPWFRFMPDSWRGGRATTFGVFNDGDPPNEDRGDAVWLKAWVR